MNILFVHQNFPGQFTHLAPALAQLGHRVTALGVNKATVTLPGVRYIRYAHRTSEPSQSDTLSQRLGVDLAGKISLGESAGAAMESLHKEGFRPDVVFAHPGWGEALFARSVFPDARLLTYAEYYYGSAGGDSAFDPEFSAPSIRMKQKTTVKNTHLLHALSECDGALSPTEYQRSQHPAWAQPKINVIHDGVDTQHFRPDPGASVHLQAAGITLRPGDEIVTFVARQLEPYRGYHIFMRSLAHLQRLRPQARVVIVGGNGVSYGAPPPKGQSWKNIFFNEVRQSLDMSRVHFVGGLPHSVLTQLMQVSAAHVYLTYPFVLSWSLMEAMSIGCLIVGSNTAPVREVITHEQNGLLTDFFDPASLAKTVAYALDRQEHLKPLRRAARQLMMDQYDLHSQCMPRLTNFVLNTPSA